MTLKKVNSTQEFFSKGIVYYIYYIIGICACIYFSSAKGCDCIFRESANQGYEPVCYIGPGVSASVPRNARVMC